MIATLQALAELQRQNWDADAWQATGAAAFETALYRLLLRLRDERAAAALRITGRIADRALSKLPA